MEICGFCNYGVQCAGFFLMWQKIFIKDAKQSGFQKGINPLAESRGRASGGVWGKAPQQRKTSKASEAKIYDHSKFTPLGLSNNR